MAEWMDGNILETEFISHSGPNAYEIHFRTPDRTKYLFVESACRDAICRDIHRCAECTNILQLRGHFECKVFDTIFFTDKLVSCEYFSKANADRKLDNSYRGRWEMDWNDPQDRIDCVKLAGMYCSYEADPECGSCPARDWCERYKDDLESYDRIIRSFSVRRNEDERR